MSQSLIGADYQYILCQLLGYVATKTFPLVVAAVKVFVDRGGSVIATGETSRYNE